MQRNFAINGLKSPTNIESVLQGAISSYFTLILTPGDVKLQNCFRLPLPSEMRRDALIVDIPLSTPTDTVPISGKQDIFRLCTTHLESLGKGFDLRRKQLEIISQKLKTGKNHNIVAGLVGGDMNSIEDVEQTWPSDLGLTDVWVEEGVLANETVANSPISNSLGRSSGHTWGYQPKGQYPPRRFDKFMYTGSLRVASRIDGRISERIERLGIWLRADLSPIDRGRTPVPSKTRDLWASDHFGIAIEVSIP